MLKIQRSIGKESLNSKVQKTEKYIIEYMVNQHIKGKKQESHTHGRNHNQIKSSRYRKSQKIRRLLITQGQDQINTRKAKEVMKKEEP